MVAVPAVSGVTTPLATVATVSSLEVQSTSASSGTVVAVSEPVSPDATRLSVSLSSVTDGVGVGSGVGLSPPQKSAAFVMYTGVAYGWLVAGASIATLIIGLATVSGALLYATM